MQIRIFSIATVGWFFLLLSTSAAAWTVDDNYDNQSVGERCGDFWANFSNSNVTSEQSSSGTKSCKMKVYEGSKGWGGGFSLPGNLKKGDELWMRFRLFMPNGFDYNVYSAGDSGKFIRISVKDSDNVTSYLDWKWENEGKSGAYHESLQRDLPCDNAACVQNFGSNSDRPVRGVWETWEIYVKFDDVPVDSGGQGRVRAWKNGKLLGDLTRRRTLNNPGDTVGAAHIFSYWNGGSPKTQHLYFDDLVATNIKPDSRDNHGNAYIGVGNFVAIAAPMPPSSIQ
jgi:hypothetical protein